MGRSKIDMCNTFRFNGPHGLIRLKKITEYLISQRVDFVLRAMEKDAWDLNCQRSHGNQVAEIIQYGY